ncbi:interleukin-31 receptor subunit alpha-like [Polyodon spathula]|uniref:interleukin-31 receptor subunit alpha-like n=1 Tax=Polyodon spathula TaxID=7913 RepID=UPI001B7EA24D|nr:interleukin-31 receptor subunit alpha-like [Polyodon spathula]
METGLSLSRPWIHWARHDINHSIAVLTGNFKPFTPYNVSVFAVYSNGTSQPSSVLVYTQQGAPSAGPEVSVSSIGHTQVNLTWREIALTHRKGIIKRYHLRLALGGTTVAEYNVSADRCWAVLSDLQPGHEYQVWVSAETEAKEGNRSTMRFSTITPDSGNHLYIGIILLCVGLVIITTVATLFCNNRFTQTAHLLFPLWCYQKVPDPVNSRLNFTEVVSNARVFFPVRGAELGSDSRFVLHSHAQLTRTHTHPRTHMQHRLSHTPLLVGLFL